MVEEDKNFLKCVRKAGALLLSSKYSKRGVPISKIKKIFSECGCNFNECFKILERKLWDVGIILKKIRIRQGTKFTERLLAIIDPSIKLAELSSFDKDTTAIIGLIYVKQLGGEVSIGDIVNEVKNILGKREEAEKIVLKALDKLNKMGLINVDLKDDKIILTELGKALMPTKELLEELISDIIKLSGENVR